MGITVLFHILEDRLSVFFSYSMIVAVSLSYVVFIVLKSFSFMPSFNIFITINWFNFIKCFFSIIEIVIWFFPSFCWSYISHWFSYTEISLYPWDESLLVMINNLFKVLLDLIFWYFAEDFCIKVYQRYQPVTFFYWCIFGFEIMVILDSRDMFESIPFPSIFLYSFSTIGVGLL